MYSGAIERVGGRVNTGNTGREVFGSISEPKRSFLKPGDFVNVKVFEQKLKGISKLPLGSLGSNNTILLVNDDLRLEKMKIDVVRFQENHILVEMLQLIEVCNKMVSTIRYWSKSKSDWKF